MTDLASQLDQIRARVAELEAERDELRAELQRRPTSEQPGCVYLTIEEAASIAGCNPRTIRRAVSSGQLQAFKPTTRVLLRESDVREWIESRPVRSAAPPRPRTIRRRAVPGSVQSLRELERSIAG